MELHAKLVRSQLNFFKPLAESCSLELTRKGQDKLGELMTAMHRRETFSREHDFRNFQGAWIMPKDERRTGVILYLHGGGYPYPAALEDALESYEYLLKKGYPARQILLCGESAGGGLIYALCLKLKELGRPLPCGLVGISPWTDLTSSGASFETNRDVDPSMTRELLTFYAGCYTQTPEDPLCSPLFGDLHGLPPSLLFVGGDEVMLDDTRMLHEKLLQSGCRSKMHIAPERWHAYVLYCLNENMEEDFQSINHFLDKVLSPARSLRWMRLDNAAKIYPAAKRRNWNNFFRLSATLTEPVDTAVLRSALDVTARRFPSMAVRLRRGVFWYYLEQIPQAPAIQPEKSCPLAHAPFDQVRRCALRVLVYHDRIAVEFFHAITDGTGGTIFLKTLLAEYLCQKYGITVPAEDGVLGRLEEPDEEELEDSFLRYAGDVKASRKEATAYHLSGTPEPDGFKNLVTLMVPADALRSCAREYGVTVTELLAAAMMQAMKDKNKERKDALSLLLSALKSKQIDKRADLTEEEENAVIFREIKQAQETIDTTPADRVQTIEEAKLRMQVYGEFAPKLMDENEIRTVIKEVLAELQIEQPTAKDKGRIMKTLMPRVKGKADGGLVNQVLGGFFA